MNIKRLVSILLTKSYVLCLTIVLVGCIRASTSAPIRIDASTETLPLSVDVPVETPHSNESGKEFYEDQQKIVTNPGENLETVLNEADQDGILLETCELSFPNTAPLDSFNLKIEEEIFAIHGLRNERFLYTDPHYLTSPPQNSQPCILPTSGGGGSGGRRMPKQGML